MSILDYFKRGDATPRRPKKTKNRVNGAKKDRRNDDLSKSLKIAQPLIEQRRPDDPSENVVKSVDELQDVQRTDRAEIAQKIAELGKDCIAFLDSEDVLFTLQNHEQSKEELIAANALKRFLRDDIGITFTVRYVTRNVYDTFRESHSASAIKSSQQEGSAHVDEIINRAIDANATDIHLHNIAGRCRVFFRIYGEFVPETDFGIEQGKKIINAIWQIYVEKQLNNQSALDGRFTHIDRRQKKWLVRVSYGQSRENKVESLAMRLRDMRDVPDLDSLGYHASQLNDFRLALGNKGVILIVGSVNSGKSTTQTAIMAGLPKNQKIVEISDQIEVELPHVVQLQLPTQGTDDDIKRNQNELIKLPTRHDVNFLAINEIRDQTTASMLASMMMQGTQGITSIHGSKWGDAINRLLPGELEISPKVLFSDSFFNMIIFQTLTGILCDNCKLDTCPDPMWDEHYKKGFGEEVAPHIRFKNPEGCAACSHSGIQGLTLVAEVIRIDQSNRRFLEDPHDSQPMTDWMKDNNVLNVHEHALIKIQEGIIDPTIVRPKIGDFNKYNLNGKWKL